MNKTKGLIKDLFKLSPDIRYVAIYSEGVLISEVRDDLTGASSSETDKYEELIVNPALLLLTKQRGDIDCGGCEFVLVRYGNFFQFVKPISNGHVSICIEPTADPIVLSKKIAGILSGRTAQTKEKRQ
jgi:hypothetical protein